MTAPSSTPSDEQWSELKKLIFHAICVVLQVDEEDHEETEDAELATNAIMDAIAHHTQEAVEAEYRRGYKAGHQQGKTLAAPRRSRAYQGAKAESVLTHFIERLPASSSRCPCITCRVIRDKAAHQPKPDTPHPETGLERKGLGARERK